MITSKAQMIKVMSQCDGADTLTREEKFQVFVRVCDNMLEDGRITKANHSKWTNIWWRSPNRPTAPSRCLSVPYTDFSQANPMQLTAQGGNMVVDFYPVKFADGTVNNKHMLKVVTFMGKSQSKRYINKKDMNQEIDSRVNAYNYEVTDIHTDYQLFNSALCAAC